MAAFAEIQEEVYRIIVREGDYNSRVVKNLLNQSVTDICAGVAIIWPEGEQTFSSPMPDLYTTGSVATGTNAYASLPTNYQREVVFIASPSGYEITHYPNFGDFRRNYPLLDMSSSVIAASVKGSNLYYQGIPSTSESLTIHYHRKPTDMSTDTDEPDGIPDRFHRTLVVYDTVLKIFREIYEEDSAEHQIIQIYEEKRMSELINLESSIERDAGSVVFKCR